MKHLAERLARSDSGGRTRADDGVRSGTGYADAQRSGRRRGQPGRSQPGSGGYGSDYGSGAGSTLRERRPSRPASSPSGTAEQLGKVVTDSAGLTLYRFDKDTA